MPLSSRKKTAIFEYLRQRNSCIENSKQRSPHELLIEHTRMAWLSVGSSNEELINKMVQNKVFKTEPYDKYKAKILAAFQNTDRGDFVLPTDRAQAYQDRPVHRSLLTLLMALSS